MREYYDLTRRAELLGREQAPFWTFDEFLGAYPVRGQRRAAAAVRGLRRRPDDRRRRALLVPPRQHRQGMVRPRCRPDRPPAGCRPRDAPADRAGRQGRQPRAGARPTPSSRSTSARRTATGSSPTCAATSSPTTRWSGTCALPVPDEQHPGAGSTRPRPRHEGYTIETFVDAVPDDLVESLCVLLGQLAVDAPTGAVDFDEEVMTPQRYAEMRRHRAGHGPGALRDARAHTRPAGRRPVDARRAPVRQHDRLPVGHVRAPRAPRARARPRHEGREPAGRPGRARRPHPGDHPERRDQRLHGLDQRADGVRAGRGGHRVRQAASDEPEALARPRPGRTATGRPGAPPRAPGSRRSADGRRGRPPAARPVAPGRRRAPFPRSAARRRGPVRASRPRDGGPTRLDASPTAYGAAQSRSSASAANQSARGPGAMRTGPGRGGLGVSRGAGGPVGAPTGSVAPSSTRGGPTQASVSVDREPSTGATSTPPATAT